MYTKK